MLNGAATIFGNTASDPLGDKAYTDGQRAKFEERAQLAADVNRVLHNELEQLVGDALRARHDITQWMEMKQQLGVSKRINPMRKAIDQWCVTWESGGTYTLTKGEDGKPVDDPRFSAHLDQCEFDCLGRRISRDWVVHPGDLVMPVVVEGDTPGTRKFIHRVFTPDRYDLMRNEHDPSGYHGFSVFTHCDDRAQTVIREDWTRETYTRFKRTGSSERWTLMPGTAQCPNPAPNPFGILPGVHCRYDDTLLWADHWGLMLLETTIEVNCAQTVAADHMVREGKVIASAFGKVAMDQVIRHAALVDTGGQALSVIDLQSNAEAFRKAYITAELENAAAQMDLPVDALYGATSDTSGAALRMRFNARDRQALARQEPLADCLEAIYWVGLQVLATEMNRVDPVTGEAAAPITGYPNGVNSLPPFTSESLEQPYDFEVTPNPLQYQQLPEEQDAADKSDVETGMRHRGHIYAREFGGTPEEGIAAVKANLAAQRAIDAVDPMLGALAEGATARVTEGSPAPGGAAPSASGPAMPADASGGKPQAGTAAAATLNGAQITAALEVVSMLTSGNLTHITAVELLVAVGIDRAQAEKMVAAEDARPKKDTPPPPPAAPNPFTKNNAGAAAPDQGPTS